MTSPAAWASTWVGDTGWWLFCDINRQNIGSADAGCWGRVESLAPRRRQLLTGLVPAAVPYFVLERHFQLRRGVRARAGSNARQRVWQRARPSWPADADRLTKSAHRENDDGST